MEIVNVYTKLRDGSILDHFPDPHVQEPCDISNFIAFIEWAEVNKDKSGIIQLDQSAYDTAVMLLGTDDISCPLVLVFEYRSGGHTYSLSIPFDRGASTVTSCSNIAL
jgi:hypothetical protein